MLNWKRIIIIIIFIMLIVGIIMGVCFIVKNKKKNIIEYIPQEEISEEQLRQTMVTLYFIKDNEVVPEVRLIDVKELINNPYEKVINLLISGPKNNNFEKTIPEGTKINKIEKNGDILIIDFSSEFINNILGGENKEKLIIESIVKTLTELTEINGIKILINGEENKSFKNGKIKFNEVFNRNF